MAAKINSLQSKYYLKVVCPGYRFISIPAKDSFTILAELTF